MVWMRDARNIIEKEGDLEAHSFVRAEIVASYLDNGPRVEVPAKLWDAPLQLVKGVPQGAVGDHIRKDGILRIQRRWVENTLPDHDLLDAVAVAYGRLSVLVSGAHQQLRPSHVPTGEAYPEREQAGRLPCMIGHADARTLDVWLATGAPIEFETLVPKVDVSVRCTLEARYGVKAADILGCSSAAEDRLRALFATARKMFEKDGYHIMIAFLLRDGRPLAIRELRPAEHGHKYLMMRSIAHEVAKLDADAVVLIGEAWFAPVDLSNPMMRAANAPDRIELLTGTVVSKTGEPLELAAEIKRDGKAVSLDPTFEARGGSHFAFAPVYEVWGRGLPARWTSGTTPDGARE